MTARRGFTLVELLLVLVVLGVLTSVAIPRFNSVRHKGFLSALRSDLENMALGQEAYFADYNTYAGSAASLDMNFTTNVNITINENTPQGWAATATHPGIPGENCGMYYGGASAANATPAITPGAVFCTIN
jgi:prepilin-type N-terminal cleavage/methylation domain-containing protein